MIENMIINILLTSAVCWWWCSFEPIQNIISKLFENRGNIISAIFYKILTCGMCVGFWGGLIITNNFMYACCISFITEMMYRKTIFN
jgi:hypothetical protein